MTYTQISRTDLEMAHRIAAQIVARDGIQFLPIFERLDNELAAQTIRDETANRARKISAETLPSC